jgi:hypothetical protein
MSFIKNDLPEECEVALELRVPSVRDRDVISHTAGTAALPSARDGAFCRTYHATRERRAAHIASAKAISAEISSSFIAAHGAASARRCSPSERKAAP